MSKYYYVLWNTESGVNCGVVCEIINKKTEIWNPETIEEQGFDLKDFVFDSKELKVVLRKSKKEDKEVGISDAIYEVVEIDL